MSRSVFTSREGGVSKPPFDGFNLASHVGDDSSCVKANRAELAKKIGLPLQGVFYMNQIHGAAVAEIEAGSDFSFTPSVDALFTTEKRVALVTLIADCVPLLMHSSGAVAAVHVGRKGLVAGVLQETLKVFKNHGITSSEISAEIGASICAQCYEVDIDIYDEVTKKVPEASTKILSPNGKPCLGVEAGLIALLEQQGIKWSSVNQCTVHDSGYFSYRRDGITGRQAGVIWLE
ncbi:MAG: peptidoglycan editing factor PgeF [Candidatus Nanopelagicaceae bacterium]|nr:peptidoglycan editing factor PgeF [Candidatus Nanopelagicaceae bacterium]